MTAIGLGSGGCQFLRDLPSDRSCIGARIAIDRDSTILDALDVSEATARVLLETSRRFSKKPMDKAEKELASAWTRGLKGWTGLLPETPSIVTMCVALGGVTGTVISRLCLEELLKRGHRVVVLALWAPTTNKMSISPHVLADLADGALSICLVNTAALASAMPRSESVQRWIALTSMVRVGHALDWSRMSTFLA